jgi:mannose-6-phosphate isomerase
MISPGALLAKPVLLNADNFVPMSRTPWGGGYIGPHYKAAVVPAAASRKIGESWEFSLDPAYPSQVYRGGDHEPLDLASLMENHPEDIFSPVGVAQGRARCDILIKLLDAAEPLSLQVHPRDDDPDLASGECGKPESWLILHAAPGAGLYLGFSRAISQEELRQRLVCGDEARDLLHFVPVKPGDYFELEPGVPHAIGAGVTLLEPQRTLAGLSGKTFRLWDWGRLYDGKPRELHLDQGLKLINPMVQVGESFVSTIRRFPSRETHGPIEVLRYPANPYYQTTVVRVTEGQNLRLNIKDGFGAMLVLRGALKTQDMTLTLATGQPVLLPHAALPCTLRAQSDTEIVLVTPSYVSPTF